MNIFSRWQLGLAHNLKNGTGRRPGVKDKQETKNFTTHNVRKWKIGTRDRNGKQIAPQQPSGIVATLHVDCQTNLMSSPTTSMLEQLFSWQLKKLVKPFFRFAFLSTTASSTFSEIECVSLQPTACPSKGFYGWLHALLSGWSAKNFRRTVSLNLNISTQLVITEYLAHHCLLSFRLVGFNGV